MPFTPSHAVVALPFVRTPLVPAAIAIGAMTPDLPLFVRGAGISYPFTHSVGNAVWTSLLALALFVLWRGLLRPAVPELAPAWIAQRLPEEWRDSGRSAVLTALLGTPRVTPEGPRSTLYPLWLAASLVLGVLSHIVWDLFTHEGRTGVQLLPVLGEMWGPLPGYKWLQHGSSALGLAIIGVWALAWMLRRSRRPIERWVPAGVRIAWWLSLPVILLTAWAVGLVAYGPLDAEFTAQHLAYRVLPPACALWGALTVVLCLTVPLFARVHRRG